MTQIRPGNGPPARPHILAMVGAAGAFVLVGMLIGVGINEQIEDSNTDVPREPRPGESQPAEQTQTEEPPAAVDLSVEVGGEVDAIGAGFDSIWVGVSEAGLVMRIDRISGEVQARIDLPGDFCGEIIAGAGHVWVPRCDERMVSAIDPLSDEVVLEVEGEGLVGESSDGTAMWTWNNDDQTLTSFYPADEGNWSEKFRVWGNLHIPDADIDGRKMWALDDSHRQRLSPVNERTGAFPDIKIRKLPTNLAVSHGRVWIGLEQGDVIAFDPKTQTFSEPINIQAGQPVQVEAGMSSVWAAGFDRVVQIDPLEGRAVDAFEIPLGAGPIVADGDTVWIAHPADGTLWRLQG